MTKDTTFDADRPKRAMDIDAEDDVEGHGLATALGLDALNRGGSRTVREQPEPELPPLTRRFPSLREGRAESPRKP
jgi:hypothetical protein